MSLSVLRSIASSVQGAYYFSVMADECVDVSNHEQLVICLRWVDHCLVGLRYYAFKIAYYALEQCSNILPITLKLCSIN